MLQYCQTSVDWKDLNKNNSLHQSTIITNSIENFKPNTKNIDMTLSVMGSSLVYWSQDLYQNKLFNKGSQIFSMTSAGGRKQWKSYGAISMAKAALESASRQLAIERAPDGIGVNAIQE